MSTFIRIHPLGMFDSSSKFDSSQIVDMSYWTKVLAHPTEIITLDLVVITY